MIDLRTVAPLDIATILESVRKTSRLLIAHEAVVPFGIGAEIAAAVARERFWYARRADRARRRARDTAALRARRSNTRGCPDRDDIAAALRRLAARLTVQQPRARAITRCWISLVPSPISSTFASQ